MQVCKGGDGVVSRIGKKLVGFDALEAGAYVVRPDVFDVLHRLLVESIYCTLAEAMQVVASEGQLSYISVGDYDWFGEQTVASLPTPASFSSAVQPEWRQRALDMLRITSPHLVALSGYSNLAGQELPPVPLYDLGDAIGAGGSSVVVQANLHRSPSSCSPMQTRRRGNLAVKVIRKGATEALGDVERSVMWEVHVLQQLSHEYAPAALEAATGHALSVATAMRACLCCAWAPATRPLPLVDTILPPDALSARLPTLPHPPLAHPLARSHIVRVMDVIEVVDATYIIMQRVDGPELTEYCERHSGRRLPAETATRILGHLLSALRHAHRHGFLHCDIKPDNVRLNKACDHAVLTDWGYARRPGERSDRFFCGTPAYASPEQLTGYSPDSVTGRRKLCPATDVWSLGVTLFEMVAGALPFPADDHEALIRSVLSTKCAHPPTHTPTHPHARTHAHPPPRTHARTRAHHTHARTRAHHTASITPRACSLCRPPGRYNLPDDVPKAIAALIEGMLSLAPSDRLGVDEIITSHHLKALGTTVPPEGPADKSLHVDGAVLVCGTCDENATPCPTGGVLDTYLRKVGLSAPHCKRMLWTMLYGSLCVGAIWSHLRSSHETVRVHYEYQLDD